MKLYTGILLVSLLTVAIACPAQAAPMRPRCYTIEGTIEKVNWHPKRLVEPGKPLFPCSPTEPYYEPAHYSVVLKETVRQEARQPWMQPNQPLPPSTRGGHWTLRLNRPWDNLGLKPGIRIRVIDYTIKGDECGQWTSYGELQILGSEAENAIDSLGCEPAPGDEDLPEYDRLIACAEHFADRGRWRRALAVMAEAYGSDVPVSAAYESMDRMKKKWLDRLKPDYTFKAGVKDYTLGGLQKAFQQLLLRPDHLRQPVEGAKEISQDSFINMVLVVSQWSAPQGQAPRDGLPAMDVARALASPDHDVVAGALFLARKGWPGLSPQAVADRWQKRPDLWWGCMDQALLYWATFPPDTVSNLRIRPDFRHDLKRLSTDFSRGGADRKAP